MSIELTYKINKRLHVKVTEENQKRAVNKMGFFSELPASCPRCDAPYGLQHRQADDFHFFEAQCDNGHISQFGQHKKGDTLFYKSNEKWKTIEERTGHTPKEEPKKETENNIDMSESEPDNLPF